MGTLTKVKLIYIYDGGVNLIPLEFKAFNKKEFRNLYNAYKQMQIDKIFNGDRNQKILKNLALEEEK